MSQRAIARSRRNAARHVARHAALALVVASFAAASVDGSSAPHGSFGRAHAAVPRNVGAFDIEELGAGERIPGPTLALTPVTVMTKPAQLGAPRQDASPLRKDASPLRQDAAPEHRNLHPSLPAQPRAMSAAPSAPALVEELAPDLNDARTPDHASVRVEDAGRQAGDWASVSYTEVSLSAGPDVEPAIADGEAPQPKAKKAGGYGRGWLIAPRAAVTYHAERGDKANQTLFQARLGSDPRAAANADIDIDKALAARPVSTMPDAAPGGDSYSLTINAGIDIAWGLVRIEFTGLVDGVRDAPEEQTAVAMLQLGLG